MMALPLATLTGWPLGLVSLTVGAVLGLFVAAVTSAATIRQHEDRIHRLRATLRRVGNSSSTAPDVREAAARALYDDEQISQETPKLEPRR